MKKKTRQILILNGLLILIVAAAILSVNSGYARISFSTAVHSIFQPHTDGASVVVAQFRVPRIVLAVLCGMGLALAGCVMQTVTGNPLADPGILGINAGAGFAVMLFLTFFPALHIRTMAYQPIFAIAGGLSAEGDPGWYRDLRAFGSVFSVPAPQVFLREDVYAFTYAGKGFVCRI